MYDFISLPFYAGKHFPERVSVYARRVKEKLSLKLLQYIKHPARVVEIHNTVRSVRNHGIDARDRLRVFVKVIEAELYAQFVRVETDFVKTWTLSAHSTLVGHVNAGAIRSYGNTALSGTPFSEQFYVGGANSIRAFTARAIGPGSFPGMPNNRQFAYVLQNGDLKLVANLEYRTRLFGKLGGALFVDVGNVWNWEDIHFEGSEFDDPESQWAAYVFNALFLCIPFA